MSNLFSQILKLSITAISFNPSPNIRIAQFEQSPILSPHTNPVESIYSGKQVQGINTYTLPGNSRLNSYDVVTDTMRSEEQKDQLWEQIKPQTLPSGHVSPCVFPFPQRGTRGASEATLTVNIRIPVLSNDPDSPKIKSGSYILVGQPKGHAYQFISDPIKIEQKEDEEQELNIVTSLDAKSDKPSISSFRGQVSWALHPQQRAANKDTIPCSIAAEDSHFMEFYVVGNNIPESYTDRKNTFGVPIYLLRLLMPENTRLTIPEYRSRVVEWAFGDSKKVYNRFTGEGHGARYVSQVPFSRSYGAFEPNSRMNSETLMEFESDEVQRFFVDWYLLESLAAQKNNINNVEKLPRVNCPDQANIVRVGLDISCMKGEGGAKILGLEGKKGNIHIDGMLVGYKGRANNAFISRSRRAEDVPIDKDLYVTDPNIKRQGFRQHFCVSMGRGDNELIYDATIARMNGNGQPVHIAGMHRKDYMSDVVRTDGAVLATDEGGMFFPAPRYTSPFLDLL